MNSAARAARPLRLSVLLVLGLLAACAQISRQIDDVTGTELAARCRDYRQLLPLLELRQRQSPQDWRANLIEAYQIFLTGRCAAVV
tara:strand:+ start:414 stop:671 length:258 start_codon:yes stop_codon:yes gene_type:complete